MSKGCLLFEGKRLILIFEGDMLILILSSVQKYILLSVWGQQNFNFSETFRHLSRPGHRSQQKSANATV